MSIRVPTVFGRQNPWLVIRSDLRYQRKSAAKCSVLICAICVNLWLVMYSKITEDDYERNSERTSGNAGT